MSLCARSESARVGKSSIVSSLARFAPADLGKLVCVVELAVSERLEGLSAEEAGEVEESWWLDEYDQLNESNVSPLNSRQYFRLVRWMATRKLCPLFHSRFVAYGC